MEKYGWKFEGADSVFYGRDGVRRVWNGDFESEDSPVRILHGMSEDKLKLLPDSSVDSIVTDPPAGIGFMGKSWDKDKGGRDQWIEWMEGIARECKRVLKPGGHALVWAIPRTSHWTAMAWENAGWEVRNRVAHIHGQGFPKSVDISVAIDKSQGKEREIVGPSRWQHVMGDTPKNETTQVYGKGQTDKRWETAPATEAAKEWDGWGTDLKPAMEDWWLLRKPLEKGSTIAANVLKHGTGALNIDGCRIGSREDDPQVTGAKTTGNAYGKIDSEGGKVLDMGRWPANILHDGSDEVVSQFPDTQSGEMTGNQGGFGNSQNVYGQNSQTPEAISYADEGNAARFFYCPKASQRDREEGLEDFEPKKVDGSLKEGNPGGDNPRNRGVNAKKNDHPTVKSVVLMRYLCRLITPPGGIVLDCFGGSGSTGKGAVLEGFGCILIEGEEEHVLKARARVTHSLKMVGVIDVYPESQKPEWKYRQLSIFDAMGE